VLIPNVAADAVNTVAIKVGSILDSIPE